MKTVFKHIAYSEDRPAGSTDLLAAGYAREVVYGIAGGTIAALAAVRVVDVADLSDLSPDVVAVGAAAADGRFLGFALRAAASTEECEVVVEGVVEGLNTNGVTAAGDACTIDGTGALITATAGDVVVGICLVKDATAGSLRLG